MKMGAFMRYRGFLGRNLWIYRWSVAAILLPSSSKRVSCRSWLPV